MTIATIERQIAETEARRDDLHDQLYSIAGEQARKDRENALLAAWKQLDRLNVSLANAMLAAGLADG